MAKNPAVMAVVAMRLSLTEPGSGRDAQGRGATRAALRHEYSPPTRDDAGPHLQRGALDGQWVSPFAAATVCVADAGPVGTRCKRTPAVLSGGRCFQVK